MFFSIRESVKRTETGGEFENKRSRENYGNVASKFISVFVIILFQQQTAIHIFPICFIIAIYYSNATQSI